MPRTQTRLHPRHLLAAGACAALSLAFAAAPASAGAADHGSGARGGGRSHDRGHHERGRDAARKQRHKRHGDRRAREARRRVPRRFMGVNFERGDGGGFRRIEHNMRMMARNGVETVRVSLTWAQVQPTRDGPYDFSDYDKLFSRAAAHGINVLPVLELAPKWARKHPDCTSPWSQPDGVVEYAKFAAAAAEHYGPGSDYGRQTGHPIRAWQIWNEPNGPAFWNDCFGSNGRLKQAPLSDYGKLLHAAREAIRGIDRKAKIVLAGLIPATVDSHGVVGSTKALKKLYRMGYGDDFDVAALHPYTRKISNVIYTVRQARKTLNHRDGRHKKIWLTELTWTSTRGHGRKIPNGFGFDVTERGQARKLRKAFTQIADERRSLGVGRIYWYTWTSPDSETSSGDANSDSFKFAGLIRVRGSKRHSKPALRAYRETARKLEGCAKTTNARRCRR